jgi:hypothetical protein
VGYVHEARVLDLDGGERLVVAGSFTSIQAPGSSPIPGRIGAWDGTTWTAFGDELGSSELNAVATFDDGTGPALVVAGRIGSPWNGIAIRRGTDWRPLGMGLGTSDPNGPYLWDALAFDDGSGPALYVAGRFESAGGAPASGVARWDGSAWSSLGAGLLGEVMSLCVFDDGTGAGARVHASRWNLAQRTGGVSVWYGASWKSIGEVALPGDHASTVDVLQAWDDGAGGTTLWCAGLFGAVEGTSSVRVGRLRACDAVGAVSCAGDGSGTACPCGNSSAPGAGAGCTNSTGSAGTLRATGLASLGQDTLVLHGSGMTSSTCLYIHGTSRATGGAGSAFGDGLRCAAGTVVRLGFATNAAGASRFPAVGGPALSAAGHARAGDVRHYQV